MSRIEINAAANAPRAKNSREGDTLVVGFASRNAVVLFGMPVSQVEYTVRVAWVPTLLSIFRCICDNRIMQARRIVDGQSFCRPKQKNTRYKRRRGKKATRSSVWSHQLHERSLLSRGHFSLIVHTLLRIVSSVFLESRRRRRRQTLKKKVIAHRYARGGGGGGGGGGRATLSRSKP